MSRNIVLDSYAVISLFREEAGYEVVAELLDEVNQGKHEAFMCVINTGEIYYVTYRKQGKERAEIALSSLLQLPIEIVEADFKMVYEAAKLKALYRLSYADAFAAALTIAKKATLITGDKEFKHLEGETNFKVKFI